MRHEIYVFFANALASDRDTTIGLIGINRLCLALPDLIPVYSEPDPCPFGQWEERSSLQR